MEQPDVRTEMLMERACRAFKLPLSADATVEERLAEVERSLTQLHGLVVGVVAMAAPNQEASLQQMEKAVLANEKRRGIVPEE